MKPILIEKSFVTQEDVEKNTCYCPTEERLAQFNKMTKEVENKPHRQLVFKPYTFNNLLEMPSKEWLLDQVFDSEDIGMIYGAPGCGKTFVVIDMILSLCAGNKLADRFNVLRCLNVAYCAGEGLGGLPSRFKAAAEHHGVSSLHNFTFYPIPPQLFDDGAEATIKQFCKEWQAHQLEKAAEALDVLIIDTLHTATLGADENSAQQMGKALHACRWIANELGCAVILVHHTNKTGAIERGSSALRGAMDFMIKIEKPSDTSTYAIMSCEKLKDGEQWKSQSFNLQPQLECKSAYVSWNDPGSLTQIKGAKASDKEKLQAEMKRYAGTRFTCNKLAESIAQSPDYTRKLLNELEQAKECQRELSNPEEKKSNKNPWVYWVEGTQEKVDLND